jgi:hypothetical protein
MPPLYWWLVRLCYGCWRVPPSHGQPSAWRKAQIHSRGSPGRPPIGLSIAPKPTMTSRQALDTAILIAATALTRFVFRSHYLYDIDSVNFALALKRFDPSVHQPHPPGYFLYVCLGRLVNGLFHDANAALVAIGIVFSCGAVAMIYVLAHHWFGRNAARSPV